MDAVSVVAAMGASVTAEEAEQPRERLRRVFLSCHDALYRFIVVRVGGDRDAADDLLQQTCCEAARQRGIPVSEGECEAWLFGIARNLVRKYWRKAKRRGQVVPLDDPASGPWLAKSMESAPLPIEMLAQTETTRKILLAITALPAADQQLIFATYFDGRSQADIADEIGVTVKSIETRLYRVRGRLRAMLHDWERVGER